jgi:hypothetical protein
MGFFGKMQITNDINFIKSKNEEDGGHKRTVEDVCGVGEWYRFQ